MASDQLVKKRFGIYGTEARLGNLGNIIWKDTLAEAVQWLKDKEDWYVDSPYEVWDYESPNCPKAQLVMIYDMGCFFAKQVE